MSGEFEKELDRIKEEYARRDSPEGPKIYTYENPAFAFHMRERERTLLKTLKYESIDLSQCDVLEVGCGNGHILQRFLEFGSKTVTGIDLMQNRIDEGKKSYPQIRLFQGDATHLLFDEPQFDLVMQFMCLSSVLNHEMRQKIASEMWRVLRPGGLLVSYDMRPFPTIGRLFFRIIGRVRPGRWKLGSKKEDAEKMDTNNDLKTPICVFDLADLKTLFPQGSMHYRTVSLHFKLAALAGKSYFLAFMMSCLPFLRTHYLVMVRKPNETRF